MAEMYPVRITVKSQKGTCALEHKVGDTWLVSDHKTTGGICLSAYDAIAARLRMLEFGGEFPWSEDKDTAMAACPDGANPVIFELRRIR